MRTRPASHGGAPLLPRLTVDEWQIGLFGQDADEPEHDARHSFIEAMLWKIASRALELGTNVILVGDLVSAAQPGRGLMARRVGVAAHQQANAVLRILLGEDPVGEETA